MRLRLARIAASTRSVVGRSIRHAPPAGRTPVYYIQIRGAEAVALADRADYVIAVVGDRIELVGEGVARPPWSWPAVRSPCWTPWPPSKPGGLASVGAQGCRAGVGGLKGYPQVDVAPGERVTVRLEIPATELTIVDTRGERGVKLGKFELRVGYSSRPEHQQRATTRHHRLSGAPERWAGTPTCWPRGARE